MRAAVRAVLHRGAHPVVGALATEHDAIGALAAAVGEAERPLLLAPLAGVIDPTRRAVLVREAVLLDGALAIELDAQRGVIGGAAVEQVASQVATFLVYTADAAPPRLTIASVTIPAKRPTGAQIDAAMTTSFGTTREPQGVAAAASSAPPVPHHPLAIARAGHAISAHGAALAPDAIIPAIVQQLLPVDPPGALRLHGDRPPYRGEEVIGRIVQRWRTLEHRRLTVLICGIRGIGKARLAAATAFRLKIPAFQLDRSASIPASLVEAIDAGAALAVLRDLGEEEIRGLESNSWWARTHGLLLVTTAKRLEPGDTSDFDLQFRLEPPTARERAALWASALATRNAKLEPGALHDLSRFPLSEHRIVMLVRTTAELTLAALVAAIQRELGVADKSPERSP
jgi:hypothetical protein